MVDILYNAIQRPIANEPDKKDIYHVDRAHKDAGVKAIDEDDPNQHGKGRQAFQQANQDADKPAENEADLTPKKKGKGAYVDEKGNKRLDFYV